MMTDSASPDSARRLFRVIIQSGFGWTIALYVVVWAGINTGPWVFRHNPASALAWVHVVRTVLPLCVCILLPFVFFQDIHFHGRKSLAPIRAWLGYGVVGLFACLVSPRPAQALYWAACYLAVFVPVFLCLQGKDADSKIILLNYCCWVVTSAILIIMLLVARDVLFVDYRGGITGYGVWARAGMVSDVAISRSSGMARFAAVPGMVAFVFFLSQKGMKRLFWLLPFFGSCTLVWLMQSRGAIVAVFVSLSFVMLFFSLRIRLLGVVMLLLIVVGYWVDSISEHSVTYAKKHFLRGQTTEELRTLTGRTLAWKRAQREIKKSLVIGHGPQADRYLIDRHVHNTYYYALLQGGILGAIFFTGGLIWAWILFFKAILLKSAERLGQQPFLMQVGGILAFFTVRSIPEVCGAMFGVDLMIMLPALAYLSHLSGRMNTIPRKEGETLNRFGR